MTNKNYLFFSVLILALSGLSGCSSLFVDDSAEVIYVYTSGMPDEERERVVALLEAQDYRIIIPDQESPFAGEGHTVVYFPFPGVEAHLSQIVSTLNNSGYGVSNQYRKETGNHWYTEGNIGVYIDTGPVEEDSEEAYQLMKLEADLTAMEFESQKCPGLHLYEFSKDGKLFYSEVTEERDFMRTFSWRESSEGQIVVEADGQIYRYLSQESVEKGEPAGGSDHWKSNAAYVFILNLEPVESYPSPYGCHYVGEITGYVAQ